MNAEYTKWISDLQREALIEELDMQESDLVGYERHLTDLEEEIKSLQATLNAQREQYYLLKSNTRKSQEARDALKEALGQ